MRKLIASTFVSLDGVMQAPGGPAEDPAGGFSFGGWTFPFWEDGMGEEMDAFNGKDRELLLGRRTYEIFEAYWPYQPDDHPIAKTFNATRKYVASRQARRLDWANSTLLEGDVLTAVAALKRQDGPDLQIIGSGDLIQSLRRGHLIDEYNVWTYPVVLGSGKRLFESGAKPQALRLASSRTSASGVLMSRYVPDGEVQVGSFADDSPSEREIARRAAWAREGVGMR
ncbi:dihydrofolate reductase family protein [Roseateles chitosanitabidus]|uniref:dihydrofolate reductase family protein n=1 Tax=Roseateles chitosanitabidus TaxID=65048 RepID=UPI000836AEB3|nr:dihydrofolate reductase family protein [Roseateles chitosanitabidus]